MEEKEDEEEDDDGEEKKEMKEKKEERREKRAPKPSAIFSRDHSRSAHERNINFESDRWIRSAVPSLRDRSQTGSFLSPRELLISLSFLDDTSRRTSTDDSL